MKSSTSHRTTKEYPNTTTPTSDDSDRSESSDSPDPHTSSEGTLFRSTLSFDTSKPLEHHIHIAIADHNLPAMYELKDICDRLHAGIPEYKGFSSTPPDCVYDDMVRHIPGSNNFHDLSILLSDAIKADASACKLVAAKGVLVSKPSAFKHGPRLEDLWMGSIPKSQTIVPTSDAIVMPKFDGCSCGVRYTRDVTGVFKPVKATTRGTNTAHIKEATDLLPKFSTICDSFTDSLNTELKSSNPFRFSNGLVLQNVKSISFRGEIVAIDKDELTSPAANYAAGKINGGMDVWNKSKDTLCFIPFEIMNITLSDETVKRLRLTPVETDTLTPIVKPLSTDVPTCVSIATSNEIDTKQIHYNIYAPTQMEMLDFLDHIGQCPYSTFTGVELDDDDMSLDLITDYFSYYQDSIKPPIDGVIYCSSKWRYPQHKLQTTSASYDKYAWKPTSETTTRLTKIEYKIARDGKIELNTHFEPFRINKRQISKCKTAPTRILKLAGIGIGSPITIELCKDIIPQIKDFEPVEGITPYELPTKCPFCKTKLSKRTTKGSVTIRCTNKSCPPQLIQKYKNFFKLLGIKGIAEGKLLKLGKRISLAAIDDKYLSKTPTVLIDTINTMSLRKFLFAMGYGTQKQIEKVTPNANDSTKLTSAYDTAVELIRNENDPFVTDVLTFVATNCKVTKKSKPSKGDHTSSAQSSDHTSSDDNTSDDNDDNTDESD